MRPELDTYQDGDGKRQRLGWPVNERPRALPAPAPAPTFRSRARAVYAYRFLAVYPIVAMALMVLAERSGWTWPGPLALLAVLAWVGQLLGLAVTRTEPRARARYVTRSLINAITDVWLDVMALGLFVWCARNAMAESGGPEVVWTMTAVAAAAVLVDGLSLWKQQRAWRVLQSGVAPAAGKRS
jgi:hypothetical protein